MTKFEALGLQKSLLDAVADLGFETPSEVQEKAIPILLDLLLVSFACRLPRKCKRIQNTNAILM